MSSQSSNIGGSSMPAREGRRKSAKDKLIRCSQGVSWSHGVPRAGPSSLQVTGKGAPVEPGRRASRFADFFFLPIFLRSWPVTALKRWGRWKLASSPGRSFLVAHAAQWIGLPKKCTTNECLPVMPGQGNAFCPVHPLCLRCAGWLADCLIGVRGQ